MDIFEPVGFGRFDSSIFGLRLNLDRAITKPVDQDLVRLTLESFHKPIGQEHRKYIASLQDTKKRSLAVSLFTLSSHETKHFHDLLITPYGSMLMRQFTRLALLSLSCFPDLFLKNDTIMLPLRDWVSDWEIYAGIIPPLCEPSGNIKAIADIIETMMTKLRAFDTGTLELPQEMSHLTAFSILEGLAIIVQEHKIVSAFGEEALRAFRQIFDADAVKRYYGALSIVRSFFQTRPTADVIGLLLFSSLCGNFQEEDPARPRYPKDLLIQMLVWLREHRPMVFSGASTEEVFACVDGYFEQELGDDLHGMSIQAAKANEGVRAAFSDIVTTYAKHSDIEGERATSILKLFSNFKDVQAAASANVMINPLWYMSSTYIDNPDLLPPPVFYIETESGFPADDELEKFYYVQSESRLDVSTLSSDEKLHFNISPDTKVIRAAHRIAPLFRITPENLRADSKPASFMFQVPELDLTLWYKLYDRIYSLLRAFIEGFDGRMIDADRRELDLMFAMVGVRVYSNGRLRDPAKLPPNWNSEAVDPTIRKLLSDEKFAAAMDALRTGRVWTKTDIESERN
jgi:hypothetical protein